MKRNNGERERKCIAKAFDDVKLIELLAIENTHTQTAHMLTLTNFDLFLTIYINDL